MQPVTRRMIRTIKGSNDQTLKPDYVCFAPLLFSVLKTQEVGSREWQVGRDRYVWLSVGRDAFFLSSSSRQVRAFFWFANVSLYPCRLKLSLGSQ